MHGKAAHGLDGDTRYGGAVVESDGIQLQALSHQCQKKCDADAVERFRLQLEAVSEQERTGQLALCFFDESGFSPTPPIQYGWSAQGQTRTCTPGSHRQRVNVLGCLQKGVRLTWESVAQPVKREHVIAFFDRLVEGIACKTVVILDNAAIHHGEPMQEKQQAWAKKGLHLLYLPPYSPELNAIEILWKQAKYFWRRFIALSGFELQQEVETLMQGFGTKYTIGFQ